MALMFQKEVALRICAAPGDAHYGRLAVLAQAATRPRIALAVPPGAFRPPPKVDSAVVAFEPLPDAARYPRLELLEAVAAAAFGQRRKMLRASLKALGPAVGERALAAAGLDPTRRAETLDQAEFRRLADAVDALISAGGQTPHIAHQLVGEMPERGPKAASPLDHQDG
jgi:16S rRNA (adenine1518-N6/adenine1519-N6)-dimethyltransferase